MKSLLINCFSIFTFLFFSSHSSAVELVVPEQFVVERLNGETFMPTLFFDTTKLELISGQNVLVLKYSEMFEDDFEDHHSIVRSQPFILIFSIGKEQQITFQYPEQLEIEDAKEYAKKPQVSLLDEQGRQLALINQALTQFNDKVINESLAKQKTLGNVKAKSTQATATIAKSDNPPNTVDMLNYWWQKATAEEREQFLLITQKEQ